MTRRRFQLPKYCHHRSSGRAFVKIEGRIFYLGKYGSQASRVEYDRIVSEWVANGRRLPVESSEITIDDLTVRFLDHADQHYRKRGRSTGSKERFVIVLRPLHELYGGKPVTDFGPLALKMVRQKLIDQGLARKTVNTRIGLIKQVFSWGCENELVPIEVVQTLRTVRGLQSGRTNAPERKKIGPISETVVDQTLRFCPPMISDMVRVQQLTGARPNEVVQMRTIDFDRSGPVWIFQPWESKMEHYDRERVIPVGPRTQSILAAYINAAPTPESFLFNPQVGEVKRLAKLRNQRKTPVQPSQQNRSVPKPKRKPSNHYTVPSYRRAIHRAAELAGVEKWSPNRIRHSRLTEIRKKYGLEAAQIIGGHAKADVTQVYAERDLEKAIKVAREIG